MQMSVGRQGSDHSSNFFFSSSFLTNCVPKYLICAIVPSIEEIKMSCIINANIGLKIGFLCRIYTAAGCYIYMQTV